MRPTRRFDGVEIRSKLAITTEELQALLSCGRYAAVQIGNAAEARIQIGKRILWNMKKVEAYINQITE